MQLVILGMVCLGRNQGDLLAEKQNGSPRHPLLPKKKSTDFQPKPWRQVWPVLGRWTAPEKAETQWIHNLPGEDH